MKLQYVAHGNAPVGVLPAIVDLHDRWLCGPRLAPPSTPGVVMVLTPGQFLDLHEQRDRHLLEFLRSHRDFQVVNSARHPELY
jgi:hypothetical protein